MEESSYKSEDKAEALNNNQGATIYNNSIQKKIFTTACEFLSRRSYSQMELKKKLLYKYADAPEEIEQTISRLVELHYLDDKRYAEDLIRGKTSRKPQGIKSLQFNLARKGFSNEVIQHAISNENIDELTLAKTAALKKLQLLGKFPPAKQKEKLYRFLLSRGFGAATIREIIREYVQ